MLLPSAFGCDVNATQHKPTRPKLPSFASFRPQPPAHSNPGGILASCRALQAILGGPLPTQLPESLPGGELLQNPFDVETLCSPRTKRTRAQSQRRITTTPPPRGANKRRRDVFEDDFDQVMQDSWFAPSQDSEQPIDQPSTPKRRRRIPLSMPLGLSAADFDALESQHSSPVQTFQSSEQDIDLDFHLPSTIHVKPSNKLCPADSDSDSGYGPSPPIASAEWSPEDDRMLVETVLTKLRLTKREWNDCARRLGKDKDSLGRRWNLLVGEGNVGLRRSRTPLKRPDLEIGSW